jgi:hypothetical protein
VPVTADQPVATPDQSAVVRQQIQQGYDAWAEREGEPSVTLGTPPPQAEAAVQAISAALGKISGREQQVVAFHSEEDHAPNGFAMGGTALVNTYQPEMHGGFIALHEFRHVIRQLADADTRAGLKDTPSQQAHAKLDSIFDHISDEGKRAYIENFLYKAELAKLDPTAREARVLELMNSGDVAEEMTADFLGARASDRPFWNDLAKEDPKGFKAFVDHWLSIIDDFLTKLRGTKPADQVQAMKIDSYIKDLNKAKMIAKDALITFRKHAPVNAEATDVAFKKKEASKKLEDIQLNESITQGDGKKVAVSINAKVALDLLDSRIDGLKKLVGCLRA